MTLLVVASGCSPSNYPEQLVREFGDLRTLMKWYANENKLPPSTLAETIREWEKMPQGTPFSIEDDSSHFRWLRSGKDPWGAPFVFDVDTKKKMVTIRSLGPNCVDELGAGDDIEHKFDLSTQAAGRIP
jgi:hypothetical protein